MVEMATKEKAQEYAEMTPAPRDRKISDARLRHYKAEMLAGRFHGAEWIRIRIGGKWLRIDGKHSSKDMLDNWDDIPGPIPITFKDFEGDTMADVADLYNTVDSKWRVRSARDIYRSVAGCDTRLANIPDEHLNVIVPGLGLHEFGETHNQNRPAMERANLMKDNIPFCAWYSAMIADSKDTRSVQRDLLLRSPVAAAACTSFNQSPDEATRFWSLVRDGSLTATVAGLRVYLLQHRMARGGKKSSSALMIKKKCEKSWRRWCREIENIAGKRTS